MGFFTIHMFEDPMFQDDLPHTNLFTDIIRNLEKKDFGTYIFEAGCIEPGLDNAICPLRSIINRQKKEQFGNYVFEAGCIEPGIDNCNVPLREVLNKLEKQ
jgi:hypothetical protein